MPSELVGTSVLFENSRVRVWEMVLAPGESCPPHSHAHDYLMVYTTPSVIVSGAPGKHVVQQIEPGAVAYHAVGKDGLDRHAITNAGDAGSHHFIIELLGPSEAATAQPVEHNGRGRVLPPGQ
jgi:beta-alanine degradation protein BauB